MHRDRPIISSFPQISERMVFGRSSIIQDAISWYPSLLHDVSYQLLSLVFILFAFNLVSASQNDFFINFFSFVSKIYKDLVARRRRGRNGKLDIHYISPWSVRKILSKNKMESTSRVSSVYYPLPSARSNTCPEISHSMNKQQSRHRPHYRRPPLSIWSKLFTHQNSIQSIGRTTSIWKA